MIWKCRHYQLMITAKPLVMGILNVTPDSFSDGGRYHKPDAAIEHGLKLAADGADILDIGGESTRPGAEPVPETEEIARVLPVVQGLARQLTIPISVDTMKAGVARRCLDAGAAIINDVSGLCHDPAMVPLARESGAGLVVMHMQGMPTTMQLNPHYDDVLSEIENFFRERMATLIAEGIASDAISLDPGIGFGKTMSHNLMLLANLDRFQQLDRPVVLGVSRKGVIGTIIGRERSERLAGSLAVGCFAVAQGAAQILRVHDVAAHRDAALLWDALAPYRTTLSSETP